MHHVVVIFTIPVRCTILSLWTDRERDPMARENYWQRMGQERPKRGENAESSVCDPTIMGFIELALKCFGAL